MKQNDYKGTGDRQLFVDMMGCKTQNTISQSPGHMVLCGELSAYPQNRWMMRTCSSLLLTNITRESKRVLYCICPPRKKVKIQTTSSSEFILFSHTIIKLK
jgi:hypothetical protein